MATGAQWQNEVSKMPMKKRNEYSKSIQKLLS
jgi:hypothetical protein